MCLFRTCLKKTTLFSYVSDGQFDLNATYMQQAETYHVRTNQQFKIYKCITAQKKFESAKNCSYRIVLALTSVSEILFQRVNSGISMEY